MLPFCGFDKCSVDSNGRIKLSPAAIADFNAAGGELVLHCLPEGAIAVYPEATYKKMRAQTLDPAPAAGSMVFRRTLRRFGAMTKSCTISPQGRLTIPEFFRNHAAISEGAEVVVAGVEIGLEIWSASRWNEEQKKIYEHEAEKGRREMETDLASSDNLSGGVER